tara:strand:- start:14197 stop:16437 length:2241 start_codon:yes stop_codon:yes gene_type:complete
MSILGSIVQASSGGAGGTSFTDVITAIDYTVTGTTSERIYVDTTSATVSITIPAGASNQVIEVIDAGENAGTNIITIVGTIDGVSNSTIEADSGSRAIAYSGTAWETSGAFQNYFKRNAATGAISTQAPDTLLANAVTSGNAGALSEKSVADTDFTNIGANVDQTVDDEFGNAQDTATEFNSGNKNTDATTPYIVTDDGSEGAAYEGWKAFDSSTATFMSLSASGASAWVKIDYGTAQKTAVIAVGGANALSLCATTLTVEGSNDDSAWTSVGSVSGLTEILLPNYHPNLALDATTAYRYLRITGETAGSWWACHDIKIYFENLATTSNTFDTRLASAASGSFSAGTFKAYDNVAALITGTGKVNVAYSVDGGAFVEEEEDFPSAYTIGTLTSNTANRTWAVSLSNIGAVGASSIKGIKIEGATGTSSVEYFLLTPNGSNWDLQRLGGETSVAFVQGVEHSFEFPSEFTVDGANDYIAVSFQSTGSSMRMLSGGNGIYNTTAYSSNQTNQTFLSSLNTPRIRVTEGTPYDQDTFKALGDIAYTSQFDLRLQLVGTQKFSKATISTPNTVLQLTSDGQAQVMDGGVKVSSFGKLGVAPVSLTTAERDALTGMDDGAIIFNETTGVLNTYNGTVWKENANSDGEGVISTALTSTSSSIATNAALSESFTHLTTENTTLANPTNLKAGKTYTFTITQSASTARTLAYGSVFKFSGGTAPTLTAVVDAVDIICGISDGTNIYCNFLADVQ